MKTVKLIQKLKNKGIYTYIIQDERGDIEEMQSNILKNQIKSGKLLLEGYKLTSNDRLIQVKKYTKFNNTNINKYVLMNKDKAVADIDNMFNTQIINGRLPYDYINFTDWIANRIKFSCVRNIREFFKPIGIQSTEDIIKITHCVSLHDTFWIKEEKSKLTWKEVSPFRNNYSKIISTYALEGILIEGDKNYFSPVISTDGSFPHTWDFNNGDIKFIKASSKYTLGGSNSGREPYSEYYASIIAEFLYFIHVKYSIRNHKRHDGRIDVVTECACYTSENIGTVTAHNLNLNSYEDVINYCKALNKESYKTCLDMFFLDCLLLNTDRHFSNIEFFINNDTLEVLKLTPIFDNNYSLLPRFIEGYDEFNRSDYIARDNRSFENLYALVKSNRSYVKELIKLKKLRLYKPSNVNIKESRLNFLNSFLQTQVNYLLQLS